MSDGPCILDHRDDHPHRAEVGLLCVWHRDRMSATNRQISDLWYDLAFIVEAGTAPKDETPKTRHMKAAEAPAPANLDVLALRDPRSHAAAIPPRPENYGYGDPSTPIPPVLTVVAGWLLCLAEERPLTATQLPKSVIAQLQLLLVHHDWIAAQLWVDDYVNEMRDLHGALKVAVRDHAYREVGRCRLPVETGTCGGTLRCENGTGVIRCGGCGATWVTAQQQAMLAVSLEER